MLATYSPRMVDTMIVGGTSSETLNGSQSTNYIAAYMLRLYQAVLKKTLTTFRAPSVSVTIRSCPAR